MYFAQSVVDMSVLVNSRIAMSGVFGRMAVGQLRWRRYRPFQVVKGNSGGKAVGAKATASADTVSDMVDASGSGESSVAAAAAAATQVGPLQAMRLLQSFSPLIASTKQPQFITLEMSLDIDVKRQSVRGVCQLPHGLKTNQKLLVFCSDFDAQEMLDAGADFAGMTELLQRIGKGWSGFDRCLATPAVMPQVMKVAKVLGPRKLMPNPKSGTLVTDLKRAIVESKSGSQIEYRTLETEPRVEVKIGSLDAPMQANLENMKFVIREVLKHKTRQSGGAADADSAAGGSGRLVAIGGISMIPDMEKLNRLLHQKRTKTDTASAGTKAKGLFVESATLRIGEGADATTVTLDPELILPSSPAYYRLCSLMKERCYHVHTNTPSQSCEMPQLFDSSNRDHPVVPDSMMVGSMDKLTAYHPHSDDPRFQGLKNQTNQCLLRFIQFSRCSRELGEEDPHCKYQFYRAQCICPGFALDDLMDERARGVSLLDQLPDRALTHIRHPQ